jgi:hypothetical protein
MHDNGYENGIFMYSYEIKKEREWWDWIEVWKSKLRLTGL